MATKLTIKSETHNRDLFEGSKNTTATTIESYTEGKEDTIMWRLEEFCKFLLAEGYSMELINKFIIYDGEVYRIEDL